MEPALETNDDKDADGFNDFGFSIFCAWMQAWKPIPRSFGNTDETEIKFITDKAALHNLVIIVSIHVDYFEGATTDATADVFSGLLAIAWWRRLRS